MKVICLTGYSGSGKSKATDLFVENLPNATVIKGSDFLRTSAPHFPKEFEEIFEMPLDAINPEDSLREGVNKSTRQHRAYMDVIASYMETQIKNAMNDARNKGFNFLIIDWIELPKMDVWKTANYRIMVDAPDDIRTNRLLNRDGRSEKAKKFYSEKTSVIRRETFNEVLQNAKPVDYLMYNGYNEHLLGEIQYLCQKIIKSHNLLAQHQNVGLT